jgi:hypothetical protein
MHEIHSINPTEKIPNLPERNALGVQLYKRLGITKKR